MKKICFMFFVLTFILVSCEKQSGDPVTPVGDRVNISVGIARGTKSEIADESYEANVNRIDVLVFKDSLLDGYAFREDITSQDSLVVENVSCSKGERRIYAIANSDMDLSKVKSEDELLSSFTFLKNGIIGKELKNFFMLGKKDVTVTDYTLVSVAVDRVVSRVYVHKITNSLKGALAYSSFEVVRAYMDNVVNRYSLDGGFVPDSTEAYWYNRMMYQTEYLAEKDPFVLRTSVACTLSSGASEEYQVSDAMYVYPNPVESASVGGLWSPRITRLVFEVKIAGVLYYYPVNMPVIKANKSYEIDEIIVTRPGSKDPDVPVSLSQATFEVVVKDWNDILANGTGEIKL